MQLFGLTGTYYLLVMIYLYTTYESILYGIDCIVIYQNRDDIYKFYKHFFGNSTIY